MHPSFLIDSEFWNCFFFSFLCLGYCLDIKKLRAKCATQQQQVNNNLQHYILCANSTTPLFCFTLSGLICLCPSFLLILLYYGCINCLNSLLERNGFGTITRYSEITVGLGKFWWVWLYLSLKVMVKIWNRQLEIWIWGSGERASTWYSKEFNIGTNTLLMWFVVGAFGEGGET